MNKYIFQSQEIDQNIKFIGNKTLNLKKLQDWGFNVPKFVAIPSYVSKDLYSSEILKKEIAKEAARILQSKKFAVRSSALFEDSKNASFAGQFTTKLDLSDEDLVKGISEVLMQAKDFLQGELDKFSIIIQEYIVPDISGVAFTRNPNGSREMMIEYGFCEGEKIVGGEIKPRSICFYWNEEASEKLPKQMADCKIAERFKDLEVKSNFPQDIEWCIKDGIFYLLQTRPNTTITIKQYEQIDFLEKQLPVGYKYFFEKTEISEIAPRPTEFTLSLLKLVYSQNGPVNKVYQKFGVNFQDTDFLHIIGNELFVDKEKEIQGLLPAFSYLRNNDFTPKFKHFHKIFPTIRNLFFLNKIKTNDYEQLFKDLKIKIENTDHSQNFQMALSAFIKDYELIFKTNLLSGLAIKKLNIALKNEVIKITDILNEGNFFISLEDHKIKSPQNLKGNSLEISDETDFISIENKTSQPNKKVPSWWGGVPDFKKKILQERIVEAIIYDRFRELGRWLTVRHTHDIRNILLDLAKTNSFRDLKNIYFANIDEIIAEKIDEAVCQQRKNIFIQYSDYCLPSSVASSFVQKQTDIFGVSAGLAQGILQNREFLDSERAENKNIILYTEILSPDLTKYFDKISGIVSEKGGILSHLAIVARERRIPVVIGYSLSNNAIKLGDHVQIDGSNGNMEKIAVR